MVYFFDIFYGVKNESQPISILRNTTNPTDHWYTMNYVQRQTLITYEIKIRKNYSNVPYGAVLWLYKYSNPFKFSYVSHEKRRRNFSTTLLHVFTICRQREKWHSYTYTYVRTLLLNFSKKNVYCYSTKYVNRLSSPNWYNSFSKWKNTGS